MPILPNGPVHIDQALTNFSVAYLQDEAQFVASRVFPIIPVAKQSDFFYIYPRDQFLRSTARKRAPGTKAAEKVLKISNDRYSADVWGLETPIPDELRRNADPAVDLERAATESVTSDMLITRELEWMDGFFKTTVWGTDVAGVAAAPGAGQFFHWSDGTNGKPIQDVETGRTKIWEMTGQRPNVMVVSPHVHAALKQHPTIVERYKYTSADSITAAMLARVFEIEEYLVAGSIRATSAETADAAAAVTTAFNASKSALLLYRNNSPTIMSPTAGVTFAWNGLFDAGNNFGVAVDQRREESILSDVIRVNMAYDLKLTGSPFGYFFDTAVA